MAPSTEGLETFIQDIRTQIELGETQLALDQLQNFVNGNVPRLQNEVSLYISRYYRLRRDERKGLMNRENAQIEQNRLENSLFDFLKEIPKYINSKLLPSARVPFNQELSKPEVDFSIEKILGINNLKQISWIQRGIDYAKSVCRILTPDGLGTGFLIGGNRLMTNHHVIESPKTADATYAEFGYEQDGKGGYMPTYRYRLSSRVFHTSPVKELDYTIVSIEPSPDLPSLETWGTLPINVAAPPIPSEHVIIIQHPNGGLKQIAMTANQVVNLNAPYIYYTTDTMPGSSGSPVFNDLWQVVAIHHAYGGLKQDAKGNSRYANEGILMSAIKAHVGDDWVGH